MSICARTTQYIFLAPCNVAISSSTGTTDQGVEGYDQVWDCWLRCTWTHPPLQRPSQDPVWQDHEEDLEENGLQWLWQTRWHLNPKLWPKSQLSIRSWPRNSDTTSTLLHSNPLCWCVPSILILYDIQTRYLYFKMSFLNPHKSSCTRTINM